MLKKKFFIPLAALSLLISTVAACNGGNKTSEPAGSSSEEPKTSEPAPSSESSVAPSSEAPSSSSSEAPHEHDYEAVGTAVKNADGKDVFLKECKSHDDKYIGIAFADFSSHSADFDSKLTQEGQYGSVPEEIKSSGFLLKKNSTVTWKINVDKAITGAKLYFGCTMTSSSHSVQKGDENGTVKYSVKVNNGEMVDWAVSGDTTYADVGLENTTDRVYVNFATVNLVAGENSIVLSQNNAGYRLIFGGEVRLHYTGDAKPVAAPEGYTVTFVPSEHVKVKVYESGSDYTQAPVETNTTKARTSDGQIAEYAEANEATGQGEVKPQVNFQVVLDEGYVFDDGIDHTFTHQEGDPENVKESPEVKAKNISWVTPEANFNKAKIIEYTSGNTVTLIYRLTKIKGNLTVTINAVKEVAQPTGVFFASAEITDAGKTALQTTNSIVPIFINLGADNAVTVSVNGVSAGACSIKSYNKLNGDLVITTASFGDLTMTYNPEKSALEKLSVVNAKTVLKWDAGQSLVGGDKLKYWNCDGTTEELQAQWNRRYGDPWTLDTNNADRVTKNTEHAISGSAMRLRPYADNRFSLATKDFSEKFTAKNISFWVYNSGSADATIQCFAYKSTGYTNFIQPFTNKTITAGKWTYVSAGFTATDLYGFQIFVAKTASALIFDDICLF